MFCSHKPFKFIQFIQVRIVMKGAFYHRHVRPLSACICEAPIWEDLS